MGKKIKFAIASYTDDSLAEKTISALSGMTDIISNKYMNRKGIYYIYSLLMEKCGRMWYGRVLELPQAYTRSYCLRFCILKLKIMCIINTHFYCRRNK